LRLFSTNPDDHHVARRWELESRSKSNPPGAPLATFTTSYLPPLGLASQCLTESAEGLRLHRGGTALITFSSSPFTILYPSPNMLDLEEIRENS
jgi:hypothetical protein